MCTLAAERAGASVFPTWISLDTLVQVLALDFDSGNHQAANFGPLLAAIIRNQAEPTMATFTIGDLAWLLEIEERCAELPEEEIDKCATAIARARLAARALDDPALRVEVQRIFQGVRISSSADVDAVKADMVSVRSELDRERDDSRTLRNRMGELEDEIKMSQTQHTAMREIILSNRISSLVFKANMWMIFKLFRSLLFGIALILIGLAILLSQDSLLVGIGVQSIAVAGGSTLIYRGLPRAIRERSEKVKGARRDAEFELEEK